MSGKIWDCTAEQWEVVKNADGNQNNNGGIFNSVELINTGEGDLSLKEFDTGDRNFEHGLRRVAHVEGLIDWYAVSIKISTSVLATVQE